MNPDLLVYDAEAPGQPVLFTLRGAPPEPTAEEIREEQARRVEADLRYPLSSERPPPDKSLRSWAKTIWFSF